jgi:MSHA biogenesis protein MshP
MSPTKGRIVHSRIVPQKGFAAVAAIFLVVGLAALGAFMLTFSNTQQLTSAQDLLGTRAYWAARAGLEWGLGSANAVTVPGNIVSATCTTGTALSVDGFSVAVTCTPLSFVEGASTIYVVQVRSIASYGSSGSPGYIERSISASLERE